MLLDMLMPVRKPKAAVRYSGGSMADPPGWLSRLFGGGPTAAGVDMNETLAMNVSAVYCAVTLYANAMKVCPLKLYRERASGGKDRVKDHPLNRVLTIQANPDMPATQFLSHLQLCKKLWGNAYAEKERLRRTGQVAAMHPIHPQRVRIDRDKSGQTIFDVDGAQALTRREMLHVPGIISKDGISGISVVTHARESLGLSAAVESYGAMFFGNGAEPGGYITRPIEAPDLDPEGERNMIESWMRNQGGANRHRPAVLNEGAEFKSIGIPNDVAQFLQTRQFQTIEVARWFNLPPFKLKDMTQAKFANVEQGAIEYLNDCLAPEFVDWQDHCRISLIEPDEQESYTFEFDMRGILWADHAARSQFYKLLFEMGVFSTNEIRALENMNSIGPAGDQRFVPGNNLVTLENAGKGEGNQNGSPNKPPPQRQEDKGEGDQNGSPNKQRSNDTVKLAMMPILTATAESLLNKEAQAFNRAAEKYAGDRPAFMAWSAEFYTELGQTYVARFGASVETLARLAVVDRADAGQRLAVCAELYVRESRAAALGRYDAKKCTVHLTWQAPIVAASIVDTVLAGD